MDSTALLHHQPPHTHIHTRLSWSASKWPASTPPTSLTDPGIDRLFNKCTGTDSHVLLGDTHMNTHKHSRQNQNQVFFIFFFGQVHLNTQRLLFTKAVSIPVWSATTTHTHTHKQTAQPSSIVQNIQTNKRAVVTSHRSGSPGSSSVYTYKQIHSLWLVIASGVALRRSIYGCLRSASNFIFWRSLWRCVCAWTSGSQSSAVVVYREVTLALSDPVFAD